MPNYRMENGKYVFSLKGEDLFETNEVSFMFDKKLSVLLRHGNSVLVRKIYQQTMDIYRSNGLNDIADDIIIVSGKFDLKEVNNVIGTCDYIGRFYTNLCEQAKTDLHKIFNIGELNGKNSN